MPTLPRKWLVPLVFIGVFYLTFGSRNIYESISKGTRNTLQADSRKQREQLLQERDKRLSGIAPDSGLSREQRKTQQEAQAKEFNVNAGTDQFAIDQLRKEGWFEVQRGIYARWCNSTCTGAQSYMDYVWRLEVWCKEMACGDIYARINIQNGDTGPVVAWTNDTGYGDIGQKVILTFQSATNGNASLIEFKARG
jgi:uncharacterized protein YmfQ (DUF2313 family)